MRTVPVFHYYNLLEAVEKRLHSGTTKALKHGLDCSVCPRTRYNKFGNKVTVLAFVCPRAGSSQRKREGEDSTEALIIKIYELKEK